MTTKILFLLFLLLVAPQVREDVLRPAAAQENPPAAPEQTSTAPPGRPAPLTEVEQLRTRIRVLELDKLGEMQKRLMAELQQVVGALLKDRNASQDQWLLDLQTLQWQKRPTATVPPKGESK